MHLRSGKLAVTKIEAGALRGLRGQRKLLNCSDGTYLTFSYFSVELTERTFLKGNVVITAVLSNAMIALLHFAYMTIKNVMGLQTAQMGKMSIYPNVMPHILPWIQWNVQK